MPATKHQWEKKTNDIRKQLDILQMSSDGELILCLGIFISVGYLTYCGLIIVLITMVCCRFHA